MTIGAYVFISKDWEKLQYPVDLWIKHNSKFFDQISIYTYGAINFGIEMPTNVKIIEGDASENGLEKFDFYIHGLTAAMRNLRTDWKVYLPSDEFILSRIDTSHFNRFLAYPLGFIQLYGNVYTEIKSAFMEYSYRIHYGNRKQVSDGGITPPYSGKINLSGVLNLAQRRILSTHLEEYKPIWTTTKIKNWAYHTNCLRSPEIMSGKWYAQMKREIDSGVRRDYYSKWLNNILSKPFEYSRYKEFWPNSYLVRTNVPTILSDNQDRFVYIKFHESEYSTNPITQNNL